VFLDIFLLLLKESQNPTFKARFKMKLTMIRQIIQTRNLVACSIFYSSFVAACSADESTLTIAPEAPHTDGGNKWAKTCCWTDCTYNHSGNCSQRISPQRS